MKLFRLLTLLTAVVICAVTVIGGCGKKESTEAKAPMTQARRDSAIAASKLPGASVVGRALTTADSAKARAKRMDDANQE